MYQAVLVEDNLIHLENIARVARSVLFPPLCELHCFSSVQAFNFEQEIYPHIAILDIELGDKENGLSLARSLRKKNPHCQIVFMSSHTDYISDVYEIPHICMILKQNVEIYLPGALQKAIQFLKGQDNAYLTLSMSKGFMRRMQQKDILFLERQGRSTAIVTQEENVSTSENLDVLFTQLDKRFFVRCHQSYIVNLSAVESLGRTEMYLTNGTWIPISRKYEKVMHMAFMQHIATQALQC